MSKWVVGCLIAVLLCVGAVGAVLYFFVQQGKEVEEEMRQVAVAYANLNEKHPFQPQADGLLDPQRVEKFFEVRRPVAAAARDLMTGLKDRGFVDKVRTAFSIGPKLGKSHVDALTAAAASLEEYRYHADELYFALRENASREEARRDAALSEVYEAYRKFRESLGQLDDRQGAQGFVDLLEATPPGRLNVPEANRTLLAQHKQAAIETVQAYVLDVGLRRFREELRAIDERSRAPATPAPADVEKK